MESFPGEKEKYGAEEIQVLEGLEAVRKRPGMYIGSTGAKGLHHLVFEIVDNAIDEALTGYCDRIDVELLPENVVSVRDNGRGVPVDIHPKLKIPALTVVFTVLHAGGKFGGSGYKISGGLHGVGASVVNALSEWLLVEVFDGKNVYKQKFERGETVSPLEKAESLEERGTKVTFKADFEIFETIVYDFSVIQNRLREQAFLNAGLTLSFRDKRNVEQPVEKIFSYTGGISDFVKYIHKKRALGVLHNDVINFSVVSSDEISAVYIAMQYNDSYNDLILSFANNIRTNDGGTHEEGFKRGLTRAFNEYARKFNFLKENDRNFLGEDVREGLTVIINVNLTNAQFEGQTKSKLGNTEIKTLVDSLVAEKLVVYFEENPVSAKAILEKAILAAKAKDAAKKAKELIRKKAAMGLTSSLPGKLADCQSKKAEETEIYIVEGDSAGGSAKNGRDRRIQAILPLWGKMLNVEKARLDKVYGNEKLTPVITALGCGVGDDIDISKLRYGKVIIMADADVDGSHIRTLLLTFFFRFMRPLIEKNHLFIAQPPLFRITKAKKHYYAFSDEERDNLLKELENSCEIQRYKGLGEMDAEQLWETTMNPTTRTVLRVTLEDNETADETFTILMGDKVEPRRKFIEKNAKYVQNLDI